MTVGAKRRTQLSIRALAVAIVLFFGFNIGGLVRVMARTVRRCCSGGEWRCDRATAGQRRPHGGRVLEGRHYVAASPRGRRILELKVGTAAHVPWKVLGSWAERNPRLDHRRGAPATRERTSGGQQRQWVGCEGDARFGCGRCLVMEAMEVRASSARRRRGGRRVQHHCHRHRHSIVIGHCCLPVKITGFDPFLPCLPYR